MLYSFIYLNLQVETDTSISLLGLILKGGWLMIPIGILSVLAIYTAIDRIRYLSSVDRSREFILDIMDNFSAGNIKSAIEKCDNSNSPITKILRKGILYRHLEAKEIHTIMESTANIEVTKLEKGMTLMATVSGAAPMLGFLGTVIGMVQAFYAMAKSGDSVNIEILSNGIYTAMITTVAGLAVGITAYILYNVMTSRINKIVDKMEWVNTEFIETTYDKYTG